MYETIYERKEEKVPISIIKHVNLCHLVNYRNNNTFIFFIFPVPQRRERQTERLLFSYKAFGDIISFINNMHLMLKAQFVFTVTLLTTYI